MDRREAVRNIVLASGATIFLTGCADRNVIEFLADGKLKLNDKHLDYLGRISEAFLPIEGVSEKIGDPVSFIMTMVNDCSSTGQIRQFATGFEQYKMLMKESRLKIKKADASEVTTVVQAALEEAAPKEDLIFFIGSVRNLSIRNLTTSEFYMTEYREYQMIPEPYEPCINV